ncbi:ribonucleoside-triphosphate reductase [Pelistega ratti]|uniref:ribonucleoside-triphosphate reductase n=1 Tax=Pelistega ratti TaxID=2652177 RepID=UPI001357B8A8|nr:ribonucleoside-triphosphate reductase [Pelistega ratti]
MLKNPYKNQKIEKLKSNEEGNDSIDSVDTRAELEVEKDTVSTLSTEGKVLPEISLPKKVDIPEFTQIKDSKYKARSHKVRLEKRDVSEELTQDQYHERLTELNINAENKHYVLFFGQPASGKTWIIGSILHYMKNYLEGMVYLDAEKTTESEEELFYQLQDCFNGVIGAKTLTSTDTKQYFELHISFTPRDSSKPPMNIVFIDASGEHSEGGFWSRHRVDSGKLPNYLMAILESKVNTKLTFVYDQSLQDEKGGIPQVNVLNAVFTHIQNIQNNQKKFFPKALLLSKADRIFTNDYSTVERNGYDPMNYALEKIPAFANSFFNESPENKTIFYRMGTFSSNSDLILDFDKECPERLFRWLYKEGTKVSIVNEPTCWDKFKAWFKGESK